MDLSKIKLTVLDPVQAQPERGITPEGVSPMDPPEAYAPPGLDQVPLEELHPFLRNLSAEHSALSVELDTVEDLLKSVTEHGFSSQADHALMHFLQTLDRDFIPHSREEETVLFPLLEKRLIADGEHSRGETVTTAVDVMRDEHLKIVQLAAVVLNLLRVGACLPQEESARTVIGLALRETTNLVEMLRLHMFREDNIVFASAHRLISATEFDDMPATRRRTPQE